MFTMQCDQCKKNADPIKEELLKLPIFWVAVFFDGEEYHFCPMERADRFLDKKVDHSEDEE